MQELRLESAIAAMQVIVEQDVSNASYKLGCDEESYLLVTGSSPWTVDEKFQIVNQLNALATGTLQKLGLGEVLQPSSEYWAAVIAMFVHPMNYFPACAWIAGTRTNADLANFTGRPDTPTRIEYTTPNKLFALVLECKATKQLPILQRKFLEQTRKQIGGLTDEKPRKENSKS